MGEMTGVWNIAKTPYDVLQYNEMIQVDRLTNVLAWALLNNAASEHDVLAPSGIVYCSAPCALIDNPDQEWQEADLEPISGVEFWALYYEYGGINPWCVDRCPHCGLPYKKSGSPSLSKKEEKKEKKNFLKRARVWAYIDARKETL